MKYIVFEDDGTYSVTIYIGDSEDEALEICQRARHFAPILLLKEGEEGFFDCIEFCKISSSK